MTHPQRLREALKELIELCAIGDVDESTEALGWGLAIQRARAALAEADAEQGPVERWVVVRQSALDVGRGDDVRTGGRPELGYALIADAATFGTRAEAIAALKEAGLPIGWVVMPLARLLPDLAYTSPPAPAPLVPLTDAEVEAVFAKWAKKNDWGVPYLCTYAEMFKSISKDIEHALAAKNGLTLADQPKE